MTSIMFSLPPEPTTPKKSGSFVAAEPNESTLGESQEGMGWGVVEFIKVIQNRISKNTT